MKMYPLVLALATFALAPQSFAASILAVESSGKELNGITLSKGGKLSVEGRSSNLVTVGAGVRTALFGAVKAYVGELLVNDNRAYVCEQAKALESLSKLNAIAVRINVTYSFAKSKLVEAFEAGFEANEVNVDDAAIKKFLAAINAGADAPKGGVITFAGEKVGNEEVVSYEDSSGKLQSIKGGAGFVRNVFALWIGKTDDSGLKKLNKNLTTCQFE